jgi:hypothetical protein
VSGITPQVLQFNYSYSLPLGRGHALFSNASTVANSVLSGWQFSGATNIQSGQPFSVSFDPGVSLTTGASAPALPGAVAGRASIVPGVALYPAKKSRTQWFNPAAFTCPQATDPSDGKSYCSGYGNSGYNMLRGPRFQNWDMSLQKNTTWLGRYKVQLRADTFNAFNHPNFGTPNADITASGAGTVTSTAGTPSYEARTMEFAIKFNF